MNTVTEPSFSSPLQLWASQDDCGDDVNSRLVRESAFFTEEPHQIDLDQYFPLHPHSQHTSTIAHAYSEHDLDSMASDNVPGLTFGHSRTSSSSSWNSDMASVVDGGCVLSTEDGVLTLPSRYRPDSNLLCPFQSLNCGETFSDVVEFKIHCFSHFRGHPLPEYAPCFLCGRPFFQRVEDDNAWAWNTLLNHMVYEHYRSGAEEFVLKPDVAIMRYMWNRGIISDADFSRTQLDSSETKYSISSLGQRIVRHVPEPPMAPSAQMPSGIREHLHQSVGSHNEPYTVNAGRRQERRQVDRLRLVARVRGNL